MESEGIELFGMVKDAKGEDVDLSIYRGKVVLVVNVASKWLVFFCSVPRFSWLLEFQGFLFLEKFEWFGQRLHRFKLHPAHRTLQQIQGKRYVLFFAYNNINLCKDGLMKIPCFSLVN